MSQWSRVPTVTVGTRRRKGEKETGFQQAQQGHLGPRLCLRGRRLAGIDSPQHPRRDPADDGAGRDVPADDATGGDHGAPADGDALEHDSVHADKDVVLDHHGCHRRCAVRQPRVESVVRGKALAKIERMRIRVGDRAVCPQHDPVADPHRGGGADHRAAHASIGADHDLRPRPERADHHRPVQPVPVRRRC